MKPTAIVYTSNTGFTAEYAALLGQATGLPVYPHIRKTNKVDDMTFLQEPLVVSSPKSAACVDYRKFVKALVEGGASNG